MGEIDILVLVFFAVYLAESFAWVSENKLLVMSWMGGRAGVFGPGLRFRNPWPSGYAFPVSNDERLSLDSAEISARWKKFRRSCRLLDWQIRIYFVAVLCSAFLPYVVPLPLPWWLGIFSIALLLHFSVGPVFWHVHKELYPTSSRDRVMGTVTCLLSPWQALRVRDLLSTQLFTSFHPAAVVLYFAEPMVARRFIQSYLLRLAYPAERDGAFPDREQQRKDLCEWIAANGLDVNEFLTPPRKQDPLSRSYCERCRLDYVLERGQCSECGRDLVTFSG